MKTLNCILMFILFTTIGNSQLSQRVAENYYNELAYVKALEYYEELAEKKDATKIQMQRTAECYVKLGNTEKSEFWYEKMHANFANDVPNLIEYAGVLKQNKNYSKANEIYKEVLELEPSNSIAQAHLHNSKYYEDLMENTWGAKIHKVDFNTEFDEFSPAFSDTSFSSMVFASNRKKSSVFQKTTSYDNTAFLDLYEIKGSDNSSISIFNEVKTKLHDGPVSFSNNGTMMYLTRNNTAKGKKKLSSKSHVNLKLYIVKKTEEGWEDLVEFEYNSDEYSVGHATVTEDGKLMFFVSDMAGSMGGTDIFKSELIAGKWSAPMRVEGVNTIGNEMFPYISNTDELYFSSDGRVGLGGLDIYKATWANSEYVVENLGAPINSNKDDFGIVFAQKEDTGFLSSNRKEGDNNSGDDIYSFSIAQIEKPNKDINGSVAEMGTDILLPQTWVYLVDSKTNKLLDSVYSPDGLFQFSDLPKGDYTVYSEKLDYIKSTPITWKSESEEAEENISLYMLKEGYSAKYTVVDGNTGNLIEGASLKLENQVNQSLKMGTTDSQGVYIDNLYAKDVSDSIIDFKIIVSKNGFFDREVKFTQKVNNEGEVEKIITLIPEQEIDVREICKINQIYYDLNKSAIRPDAALELDKLILCMEENPSMTIEIGSHTDCRGSSNYNKQLSDKRAKSCMRYVISKGIDKSRIFGKGYGENKLVNDCECEGSVKSSCSEEEHQENRRTEFKIII